MAVKPTAAKTTTRTLIPPEESSWQKYSPHFELPLASATSLFLHGTIIGFLAIAGMSFMWAAREEAAKPPSMDVVMIEGVGNGFEGLGGEAGLPGAADAGAPKRTEMISQVNNPDQPDREVSRSSKDSPLELGLPLIDDGKTPLNAELSIELERIAKEAAEQQAKKETKPATPLGLKPDAKKPGPAGTGNPKGKGGLGGLGDGMGKGNKKGTDIGTGGIGGRKATNQEIFAWRWNFSLGNDGKEHARMLGAIGVRVAIQDAKGQFYFITDLNRRPAQFERGNPPPAGEAVGWSNSKAESLAKLAIELQLPFIPVRVHMMLPKEREEKMRDLEERFARDNRRDLKTVRRTWFDFQLRNGVYEPVVNRME